MKKKNKKGEGLSPQAVDNFAPSRPLPRPEQCVDHQDGPNPHPCPGCAEARRTMAYVRAEMVAKPCPDHGMVGKCRMCPGGDLAYLEELA